MMRKRLAALLIGLGLATTAAAAERGPDGDDPGGPSAAERYEAIRAEYDEALQATYAAMDRVEREGGGDREQMDVYEEMAPDVVAYCRRMLDLAASARKEPAARDALLWVINHPNRSDQGEYGVECARAAAWLVLDHGDDPEAVRIGLGLDNIMTPRRDALLFGFYAAAEGREAKGLARLALAKYLRRKADFAEHSSKAPERQTIRFQTADDDGQLVTKEIDEGVERHADRLQLAQLDPDRIRAEAERLLREVLDEYAYVPFKTHHDRELERLLRQPEPKWAGKPLTDDDRRAIEQRLAKVQTLGEVAEGLDDDWHNLAVGKPAPEIVGEDVEGRPLKLSGYRGKVVALAFWGSWCGPCMAQVPHERQLVERYAGRPFALLGVNCGESKEVARETMAAHGMTWPSFHDGEDVGGPIVSLYHVRGYPTVFVIDAEGVIRSKDARGDALDRLVDELLKEAEAR